MSRTKALDAIEDLFTWSSNYSYPTPATLFLDLIGYSEDHYGERLCVNPPQMGYVELGYLGEALSGYADYPGEVWDKVQHLLDLEAED
jgi:hypothetical protein